MLPYAPALDGQSPLPVSPAPCTRRWYALRITLFSQSSAIDEGASRRLVSAVLRATITPQTCAPPVHFAERDTACRAVDMHMYTTRSLYDAVQLPYARIVDVRVLHRASSVGSRIYTIHRPPGNTRPGCCVIRHHAAVMALFACARMYTTERCCATHIAQDADARVLHTGNTKDPDLRACGLACFAYPRLLRMNEAARRRVARYIRSRYGLDVRTQQPMPLAAFVWPPSTDAPTNEQCAALLIALWYHPQPVTTAFARAIEHHTRFVIRGDVSEPYVAIVYASLSTHKVHSIATKHLVAALYQCCTRRSSELQLDMAMRALRVVQHYPSPMPADAWAYAYNTMRTVLGACMWMNAFRAHARRRALMDNLLVCYRVRSPGDARAIAVVVAASSE